VSKCIPVLVIEDDEWVLKALKQSLKSHGFEVHVAKDGSNGLKLAREIRPALILLARLRSEMDGLEILYELKHSGETRTVPVFMLTAEGMIGDLDQAFEIGADDYITKPLDLMQLGRMVKSKWERFTSPARAR